MKCWFKGCKETPVQEIIRIDLSPRKRTKLAACKAHMPGLVMFPPGRS